MCIPCTSAVTEATLSLVAESQGMGCIYLCCTYQTNHAYCTTDDSFSIAEDCTPLLHSTHSEMKGGGLAQLVDIQLAPTDGIYLRTW